MCLKKMDIKATLHIYYTFRENLKVIFKHCLNVLIENIHLSNLTHLLHLSGDIKGNI